MPQRNQGESSQSASMMPRPGGSMMEEESLVKLGMLQHGYQGEQDTADL